MSRLAYIMGTFPALTETFVVSEIEALERTGVPVELFSLRRPSALEAEKARGTDFVGRTSYGPTWSQRALAVANLRMLTAAPARYLRTVASVLLRTALNPVHCLKLLALFPVAVAFAELMRQRGVTHVHAHWAIYPAAAAYVVARVLDIPYSFTAHAHDATAIRSLMREKIRRAAFVMTCTAWTQSCLWHLVPEAREKILLNYHGVALDRFAPDHTSLPAPPARFTIVSCGSLYPRKGFLHLLEACRLLRDRGCPVDCVIVGEGPMRAQLQRFIDRHQLGEDVTLVGAVSAGDVIQYYRRADLFVLACITAYLGWRDIASDPLLGLEVGPAIPFRPWMDGIPNVLLEAMAMEVAVVSTHVGGIPELIESGQTGILVPEKDPGALATAIEQLLRDPVRRHALARRGRNVVRQRFDREQTIQQLVEIFAAHARTSPTVHGAPGCAYQPTPTIS